MTKSRCSVSSHGSIRAPPPATGPCAKTSPDLPVWTCKLVGGTTVHWAGCALRFQEHEFKTRTRYGDVAGANLMDWPIGLQETCAVLRSRRAQDGRQRHARLVPLPTNNNGKVLVAGAKKLGYAKYQATKMAINSVPHAGRAGCQQAGFSAGLHLWREVVPLSTPKFPLPKPRESARSAPNRRCCASSTTPGAMSQAMVPRTVPARCSGRRRAPSRLAANSIESPRLLLNSSSSQFPHGLANSSGQVGCNYMRHTSGAGFATLRASRVHVRTVHCTNP